MAFMTIEQPRSAPPKLTGPIPTRAEARKVYAEIVANLNACGDMDSLDLYLMTVGEELIQFRAELDWLWQGDGDDFYGLDREIDNARARLRNRLD